MNHEFARMSQFYAQKVTIICDFSYRVANAYETLGTFFYKSYTMESVIRYILLFVVAGILLVIFFSYQARQKRCRLKEQLKNINKNYPEDSLSSKITNECVSNFTVNTNLVDSFVKKDFVANENFCIEENNNSFADDFLYAENFQDCNDFNFDREYLHEEEEKEGFYSESTVSNFGQNQNYIKTPTESGSIFKDLPFTDSLKQIQNSIFISCNKKFGGYSLLQTILAHDLHYAEDKLFHKILQNNFACKIFSIKPQNAIGYFDLSNMQSFECDKLVLELNECYLHADNFALMRQTAEDLADDLGGIVTIL